MLNVVYSHVSAIKTMYDAYQSTVISVAVPELLIRGGGLNKEGGSCQASVIPNIIKQFVPTIGGTALPLVLPVYIFLH